MKSHNEEHAALVFDEHDLSKVNITLEELINYNILYIYLKEFCYNCQRILK